nr:MgtC/SapB family protein [Romboutsia faecis]
MLKTSSGVKGLTTSAGIWSTACIGIAIGYGYYFLAIVSWVFLIIVLYALKYMEMWHRGKRSKNMVLTIEDTKSIPALMEVVKEIDNKILSIEKNLTNLCLN